MDGDSSESIAPGSVPVPAHIHAPTPVPVPADRSEVASEPGGYSRPRKFVIQSTFGVPRERRSRKSRPCDACRRRKTACIITTEPPCVFCKTRGIICQSTAAGEAALARSHSSYDHATSGGSRDREQTEGLGSPNTAKSSPRTVTSPSASAASEYSSRFGHEPTSTGYTSYGFIQDGQIKSEPDSAVMSMDIVQPALNSPESSVNGTAYTLEDNPGRSTYFLGSTAEQDPFVLDGFSYGILSETSTVDANVVQIHRGGSDLDDLPQHYS